MGLVARGVSLRRRGAGSDTGLRLVEEFAEWVRDFVGLLLLRVRQGSRGVSCWEKRGQELFCTKGTRYRQVGVRTPMEGVDAEGAGILGAMQMDENGQSV